MQSTFIHTNISMDVRWNSVTKFFKEFKNNKWKSSRAGMYGNVYITHGGVAIKRYTVEKDCNDLEISIFREITALRELTHAGIVELTSAYIDIRPGSREAAISLCAFPRTLGKFIKHEHGVLGYEHRAQQVIRELSDAIGYIHASGFIHLDLKPDNIMMTSDDHVKIIDFGLCKFVGNIEHWLPPDLVVTRWYRPPEVLYGRMYNHKVDVWSVACIIYEIITGGVVLFNGHDDIHQMRLIRRFRGIIVPIQWSRYESSLNAMLVADPVGRACISETGFMSDVFNMYKEHVETRRRRGRSRLPPLVLHTPGNTPEGTPENSPRNLLRTVLRKSSPRPIDLVVPLSQAMIQSDRIILANALYADLVSMKLGFNEICAAIMTCDYISPDILNKQLKTPAPIGNTPRSDRSYEINKRRQRMAPFAIIADKMNRRYSNSLKRWSVLYRRDPDELYTSTASILLDDNYRSDMNTFAREIPPLDDDTRASLIGLLALVLYSSDYMKHSVRNLTYAALNMARQIDIEEPDNATLFLVDICSQIRLAVQSGAHIEALDIYESTSWISS